mmetsp:Transcript_7159/g.18632  ORF Transcript_7159/g.18632 Transcript_7159/m.18632 type:complete len:200 (-) Transcript_7159:770-1369(-)
MVRRFPPRRERARRRQLREFCGVHACGKCRIESRGFVFLGGSDGLLGLVADGLQDRLVRRPLVELHRQRGCRIAQSVCHTEVNARAHEQLDTLDRAARGGPVQRVAVAVAVALIDREEVLRVRLEPLELPLGLPPVSHCLHDLLNLAMLAQRAMQRQHAFITRHRLGIVERRAVDDEVMGKLLPALERKLRGRATEVVG